jgi:hypothetical protein
MQWIKISQTSVDDIPRNVRLALTDGFEVTFGEYTGLMYGGPVFTSDTRLALPTHYAVVTLPAKATLARRPFEVELEEVCLFDRHGDYIALASQVQVVCDATADGYVIESVDVLSDAGRVVRSYTKADPEFGKIASEIERLHDTALENKMDSTYPINHRPNEHRLLARELV